MTEERWGWFGRMRKSLRLEEPADNAGNFDYFAIRSAYKDRDVSGLIARLDSPRECLWAAKYLGAIGADEAIPDLLGHLDSPNPHMRASVSRSLGVLGATEALPRIQRLATDDEVEWVRSAAVEAAAGLVPVEQARPLLYTALDDDGWNARLVAARMLGRFGDRSDLTRLKAAQKAEPWWSRGAYRKAKRSIFRREVRRRLSYPRA